MKNVFAAVGLAAGLSLASYSANAAVLTFEGQSNQIYTSPITRSGFVIGNPVGQEHHFHEIDSRQFGLPNNGTGILLNDRNTELFITEANSSVFALGNLDVAASTSNSPAASLSVFGYLNNVLTGTFNIVLTGNFQTISGSILGAIDRVVFDGIGGQGGFVLDNVNLNEAPSAVPLPGALPLFASALGLGGFFGWKRKRRAAMA